MTRLPVVLVAVLAFAAVAAVAAAAPAPKGAYVAAYARAIDHYANPDRVKVDGGSLRSTRDPAWSLVNGSYGKRGLWAAWVRRSSGRYVVKVFRTTPNLDPGTSVPCDIRPARSEPSC